MTNPSATPITLGIDASNIRDGGGLTHLAEFLRAARPHDFGISRIVVWGSEATLARLEKKAWLCPRRHPLLDRSLLHRTFWQSVILPRAAAQEGCDLLFFPGGVGLCRFRSTVAMSQNLLPFMWQELLRFGASATTLRLILLRALQTLTFRRADGVIFLSQFAQATVSAVTGPLRGKTAVVPHGVDARFLREPPVDPEPRPFTQERPCSIIYVSIINPYKHQEQVVRAVARLRAEGYPVVLELIGPPAQGYTGLVSLIGELDPAFEFLFYRGAVPHEMLHQSYAQADINVFASSCENLPIILIEGMAAGLPTACSNRGPMPEVLGSAGVYFDPENPEDIAATLRTLLDSPELRVGLAQMAYARAKSFSWHLCADATLSFLAGVVISRS